MITAQTRSLADEADRYRRENRLPSWEADPASAESSASTLGNSIGEHSGRWLYELFQNAEDAEASICRVRLIGNDLLITDSGKGIARRPKLRPQQACRPSCPPSWIPKDRRHVFAATNRPAEACHRMAVGTVVPVFWRWRASTAVIRQVEVPERLKETKVDAACRCQSGRHG